MSRLIIVLLVCILLVTGVFVGCNHTDIVNKGEIDENKDIQLGNLNFEHIQETSLDDESLKNWFENNYKNEGISSKKYKDHVYILLGGGEQNTGGYSTEITSIVGKENEIVINGKLNSPKEGEMVIQALTYPNTIIKIAKDDREIILGNFEKPVNNIKDNKVLPSIIKSEGIYVGQIDNNFIEIVVERKPEQFVINKNIKEYFDINSDKYKKLNKNDKVYFSYQEDESTGHLIILDIYKDKNVDKENNSIEGKYIGQIDNNSVEIEVNNEIGAYRLSDRAKMTLQDEDIDKGDIIYFNYEKNEYNQFIILDIIKIEKRISQLKTG